MDFPSRLLLFAFVVNKNVGYFAVQDVPELPAAPIVVTADAGTGKITISWDAVAGAKRYVISRRAYNGTSWGEWTVLSKTLTGVSCNDKKVTSQTRYQYRVEAYNEAGSGGYKTVMVIAK